MSIPSNPISLVKKYSSNISPDRGAVGAWFVACKLKCTSSNFSQILIKRSLWIPVNHTPCTFLKVFFFSQNRSSSTKLESLFFAINLTYLTIHNVPAPLHTGTCVLQLGTCRHLHIAVCVQCTFYCPL